MSHFPLECLPKSIHRATKTIGPHWNELDASDCRYECSYCGGSSSPRFDECVRTYRNFMFQRFTHGNQFQCTQSDQPETAEHAYYTEKHELEMMKSGFGQAMLHLTESIFGCKMEATNVYTNAMQFGDAFCSHRCDGYDSWYRDERFCHRIDVQILHGVSIGEEVHTTVNVLTSRLES